MHIDMSPQILSFGTRSPKGNLSIYGKEMSGQPNPTFGTSPQIPQVAPPNGQSPPIPLGNSTSTTGTNR